MTGGPGGGFGQGEEGWPLRGGGIFTETGIEKGCKVMKGKVF